MKNEINVPKYLMEIAEDITESVVEGKSKMDLRAKNERRKKSVDGVKREGAVKK